MYPVSFAGSARIQATKMAIAQSIVTILLSGSGNTSSGGFHASNVFVHPKRMAMPDPINNPATPTSGPRKPY
jgi:hypothetical protein